MLEMLGSFDLSSFWNTPASIWRARKLAGRHHDVVAGTAGQQLGLEDLVGVEDVVDDLDAGLLGEFLDDRRVDVVRPVVDVDDLVLGMRRQTTSARPEAARPKAEAPCES